MTQVSPQSFKFVLVDNTEKNENIHTIWNRHILTEDLSYKYWINVSPDVLLQPECLLELVAVMEAYPHITAVGPSTDNTYNEQGGKTLEACERVTPLSWVPGVIPSGFCCAYSLDMIRSLGGFREDFVFYGGDLDMVIRMRHAGCETAWAPRAYASHIHGEAAKQLPQTEYSRLRALGNQQLARAQAHYAPSLPGRWIWSREGMSFSPNQLPKNL